MIHCFRIHYILFYYNLFLVSSSHNRWLEVFHSSLLRSKLFIGSSLPLISNFFFKSLVTILSTLTAIGMTVIFIFHSYLSAPARSK